MKLKTILIAALLFVSYSAFSSDGKQLFLSNCSACHSIGKGKLTGPDLINVDQRHDSKWLVKWITSSQSMVKSGDEKAVKLFNDNNKIVMPDQPLKEAEVTAVLAYIKTAGEEITKRPVVSTPQVPVEIKITPNLLTMFTFTEYLLMFLMLLILVVMWVMAKSIYALAESKAKAPQAKTFSERPVLKPIN